MVSASTKISKCTHISTIKIKEKTKQNKTNNHLYAFTHKRHKILYNLSCNAQHFAILSFNETTENVLN